MADRKPDLRNEMPGALFSGDAINGFAGGWAKLCFIGEKPHYWRDVNDWARAQLPPDELSDDMRYWESLCGVFGYSTAKTPPLAVGNYQPCKRCMKKAPTWPRKEERTTIYESDPRVRELFRRG